MFILIPVITTAVYYGNQPWDGPRTLHDMLDCPDRRILSRVRNYEIDIIEPAAMTDDELEKFNSSLKEVMTYIKYSADKVKLCEAVEKNERFRHLSPATVQVINSVTGSKIVFNEKEESIDMCKAIQDLRRESEAIGEAKGEAKGRAKGEAKGILTGFVLSVKGVMKETGKSASEAINICVPDMYRAAVADLLKSETII